MAQPTRTYVYITIATSKPYAYVTMASGKQTHSNHSNQQTNSYNHGNQQTTHV